ncbi:MAG: AMP-binding protein [Pseudomonadota bacterium]
MSLYTQLCSEWVFPIHERLKGHSSVALRKQLEESQWFSPDVLQAYRVRRLRSFLTDIGKRVPYYRSLFRQLDFDPGSVHCMADLCVLPLLGKPEIRANLQALKAQGHGPLTRYNTGGSSGEPLVFFMGRSRKSHDVAAKWRATRWWGVDIGDPEMVVWGSPIELGAQDRLRRLRDGVLRSHLLAAFDMSLENLDHFVAAIVSAKPRMLFGYPSSLALIADHALRRQVDLSRCGIRVVFVTSERLYDNQRTRISEVFGCPVANGYGARDAGFIAHQCPMGSLHISAEDIVVETVRPDGQPSADGEVGEIVVTHMATPDFPFVRYRTGDMGSLSKRPCACGRGLPVLANLEGRSTDFVVARDGTVLHGLALIYTLRDLPEVAQFQIRQVSLDLTVVKVAAPAGLAATSQTRIVRDFKARLGETVEIRIESVAEIAPEASGKYRYVLSQVDAFGQQGRQPLHA